MQASKIKLFIVDDDEFFSEILKDRLQENTSLTITTYATAEKCLTDISQQPQVILLDYFLNKNNPEAMNGLEALRKIKQLSPETKVIALSGQDSLKTADELLNSGAYDYLIKDKDAFKLLEKKIARIMAEA